jgi:hypothetical protein
MISIGKEQPLPLAGTRQGLLTGLQSGAVSHLDAGPPSMQVIVAWRVVTFTESS